MPETRTITTQPFEAAMPFASATFGAGSYWWQWYAFAYGYYFYPSKQTTTGAEKIV